MDVGKTIKIDIKDAIDLLAEAWERVNPLIIKNCWCHSKILALEENEELARSHEIENLIDVSFLISSVEINEPMEASEFIDSDDLVYDHMPKNDEIVNEILAESNMLNEETFALSSNEDEPISIINGIFYIQKTIEFLEQQDFSNFKEIRKLKIVLKKAAAKKVTEDQLPKRQMCIQNYFKKID